MLNDLLYGFSVALSPENLFFAFVGVTLGMFVGALPGLGPTASISILIPLTFGMEPATALIMLAALYYGSMYGGSITSVLLNMPGESASVMTAIDGYGMTRRGRGGAALGISAYSSFIGGTLAVIAVTIVGPSLAEFGLRFGAAEYSVLILLAFVLVLTLGGDSLPKAIVMTAVGLLLGCVGFDVITGEQRYTFGTMELLSGVNFIPITVGLFGISEVIRNLARKELPPIPKKMRIREVFPNREETRASVVPSVRGGFLGFVVGILPGAGATVASFLAYGVEKRVSRHPERFGHGTPEGVAAPESANNSAATGAVVPMLALGIPGSAATAVILGALLLNDVTPGPLMISEHRDVFWGFLASMYIGNIMLVVLSFVTVPMFASLLRVPFYLLAPFILAIALVGTYSVSSSVFQVATACVAGAAGVVLSRYRWPLAPLILAMVLGPMLEANVRRALKIAEGDPMVFADSTTCQVMLVLAVLVLSIPLIAKLGKRRSGAGAEASVVGAGTGGAENLDG